ncbi:MAG: RNA polymerase sigma factor [Bacteroidota bacterium]|nr:RNA polymerase sigma factor [Bacteroidota bacterium]
MHSEEEMIRGCCCGDRKLQRKIYECYAKKMLVVCLRYAKERQEAEDVLQESFVKVFNNIQNFRKESSLESWIKRIVINTALNSQRSKLYLYPMVDLDLVQPTADREIILAEHNFQDLLKTIQELPTGCQVIFNLHAIEGYPHKEIAKMIGVAEGTVKSQYSRAKALLKKRIEEMERINYEKFK